MLEALKIILRHPTTPLPTFGCHRWTPYWYLGVPEGLISLGRARQGEKQGDKQPQRFQTRIRPTLGSRSQELQRETEVPSRSEHSRTVAAWARSACGPPRELRVHGVGLSPKTCCSGSCSLNSCNSQHSLTLRICQSVSSSVLDSSFIYKARKHTAHNCREGNYLLPI